MVIFTNKEVYTEGTKGAYAGVPKGLWQTLHTSGLTARMSETPLRV